MKQKIKIYWQNEDKLEKFVEVSKMWKIWETY